MNEPAEQRITCYSAGESEFMRQSQAWRSRWLRPLLLGLERLGCRAGHLTLLSFFYTVVVLFAMARNALAIPYSWLVRPRFFVFVCIPVELYLWRGSLNLLLWILAALLAWKTLTGFVKIRRQL